MPRRRKPGQHLEVGSRELHVDLAAIRSHQAMRPPKIGYLRLETDVELAERIWVSHREVRQDWETLDQVAERHGMARRLIEVIP